MCAPFKKMVKTNKAAKRSGNQQTAVLMFLIMNGCFMLLSDKVTVEASKGDDIIMTKGKLIMRGAKGKGKIDLMLSSSVY